MENGISIKWLMRGLLVPVRLDAGALNWPVVVSRNRFTPNDTYPVSGCHFDYTNQRIVLNTWSPKYQSPLLEQKNRRAIKLRSFLMPRMYREIVWEDEEKYSPPPPPPV